jgi:hypothetical protein
MFSELFSVVYHLQERQSTWFDGMLYQEELTNDMVKLPFYRRTELGRFIGTDAVAILIDCGMHTR